jgi:hypothetical protein
MCQVTISSVNTLLLYDSFLAKPFQHPEMLISPLFKEDNPLNTIDHKITCVHTNPILSLI